MYQNNPHLAKRNSRKIEELKELEISLESKCKVKYIDDNNFYSLSDKKKLLRFLVNKLELNYILSLDDAGVYWNLAATRCELRIRNALAHYFKGEELLDIEKDCIRVYIEIYRGDILNDLDSTKKLSHTKLINYASGHYSIFERAAMDEIYDTIIRPENEENRTRLI